MPPRVEELDVDPPTSRSGRRVELARIWSVLCSWSEISPDIVPPPSLKHLSLPSASARDSQLAGLKMEIEQGCARYGIKLAWKD
ncbi:hypothetical protein BCR35DRAFT_304990 [Leucosporidium creatinivorum]|uniref:Uncharacterized protein n=1 Tax=Leucosporidium creatinivorum TaxID=106004 RepID=A0A1Y2F3D7_9BASI|nr:hypothetical protein BCR35DRAFT_304990 [Leucosporidium creatinivorum]